MKRPAAATLELNKAHWPVTVLGPGRRIGLWLQGCTIGCRGCVSQDTWPRDAAKAIPVAELLAWCARVAPEGPDGITISGGEPFEQPAGLLALLKGLDRWRRDLVQGGRPDFDILCYSGQPMKRLQRDHARLLALIDALIPEPYVDSLPVTHVWRGSGNQPLVALTERGRLRYAGHVDAAADAAGKRMQVAVEGGRVWMIGIPARGDMERVEALCAERGPRPRARVVAALGVGIVAADDYVRVCPVCERENPPGLARCACGAALAGVDFSLRRAVPSAAAPAPTAAAMQLCPHADCRQPNPPGRERCVYCNRPLLPPVADRTAAEVATTAHGATGGATGNATGGAAAGGSTLPQAAPAAAAESRLASARPLPSALRGDYRVKDAFAATGSEADLLLVERVATGEPFVAKLYRKGLSPDLRLLDLLARADGDYVVRVVAHGVSDGVAYEVQEYLPQGTLRDLLAAGPLTLSAVRRVVKELADALDGIHAQHILHRDLKPENVLVRSKEPLELALSDFGIASLREATQHFTGGARTAKYAAPEALTGVLDDKADWWALGMIALEAASGRHPFDGLSEQVINHHLATRPVDVHGVRDDALATLCRGLLLRDPKRRWGGAEVARWLAGDATLSVPDDADAAAVAVRPYKVGDVECRSAAELAVALARNWEAGAKDVARGQVTRWIEQALSDHNLARRLSDIVEQRAISDDLRLLRFLRVAAPGLPPVWRGLPVSRAALLAVARKALGDDVAALRWLDSIAREQVLAIFAEAGDDDLREIDRRWREGWARFLELWKAAHASEAAWRREATVIVGADASRATNLDALMYGASSFQAPPRQELVNGPLLLTLFQPGFADALRAEVTAAQGEVAGGCRWFDALHDLVGVDPIALLVARALLPQAREDAAAERARQGAARAARERSISETRSELRAQLAEIQRITDADAGFTPEAVAALLAALERFQQACGKALALGYPEADYVVLCRGAEKLAGHAAAAQAALAHCEELHGLNAVILQPQRLAIAGVAFVGVLLVRIPWVVLAAVLVVGAVVGWRWYVVAMARHRAKAALRWLQLHVKTLGPGT